MNKVIIATLLIFATLNVQSQDIQVFTEKDTVYYQVGAQKVATTSESLTNDLKALQENDKQLSEEIELTRRLLGLQKQRKQLVVQFQTIAAIRQKVITEEQKIKK